MESFDKRGSWGAHAARSEVFSYLTGLHITTLILLGTFSLVKTISFQSGRDHCPGMQNTHFRFSSVPQKRHLLKLSNAE